MFVRSTLALLAGALAVATSVAAAPPRPIPIIVTRDSSPLPASCAGPRGVAALVLRFTDAFDRGDTRTLGRLFGRDFQSYWVGQEGRKGWGAVTFSQRRALFRYFARRHRARERLRPLIVASYVEDPQYPGAAGISFWLERTANDLARAGIHHPLAHGKGIVDCRRKSVVRFGFGMPRDPPVPAPYWPYLIEACPIPQGWSPADGVVACT
jgi:hypothetical protein